MSFYYRLCVYRSEQRKERLALAVAVAFAVPVPVYLLLSTTVLLIYVNGPDDQATECHT